MIYGGQDVSFEIIPVDNNGIKLKEELGLFLFHQLSDPPLGFLAGEGSLSNGLLCVPLIWVKFMPSDHPLDLPGRDFLRILLLIENLQLLLAIARISLS